MKIEPKLHAQTCPCCDQTVKLYARRITDAMVFQLKVLAATGPCLSREWSSACVYSGLKQAGVGDMTKLAYWGLIKKSDIDHTWRVTDKGFMFLDNDISVPRYAYVYNGKVIDMSHDDRIRVTEVSHFDFAAL